MSELKNLSTICSNGSKGANVSFNGGEQNLPLPPHKANYLYKQGGAFFMFSLPDEGFWHFAEWQCERCSKLLSVNTLKSSYSLSVTMLPRIFIHAHFYQEPANRGADVGQLNCHSPLQDISMPISRVEVVRKHCCRPLTRQRALSLEASVCSLLSKSLS